MPVEADAGPSSVPAAWRDVHGPALQEARMDGGAGGKGKGAGVTASGRIAVVWGSVLPAEEGGGCDD